MKMVLNFQRSTCTLILFIDAKKRHYRQMVNVTGASVYFCFSNYNLTLASRETLTTLKESRIIKRKMYKMVNIQLSCIPASEKNIKVFWAFFEVFHNMEFPFEFSFPYPLGHFFNCIRIPVDIVKSVRKIRRISSYFVCETCTMNPSILAR